MTRVPVASAIVLLLTVALFATACSSAPSGAATTAPIAKSAPTKSAGNNIDCLTVVKANEDFGTTFPLLINFTADTDYSAFTDQSSPVYVDFVKTRKDLDSLALLPDPTDAVELTFGKPSESVAYFRQVVDLAEGDLRNNGKPFKDTGVSGQKVIGFDTQWGKEYAPFALAIDKACHNFSLPADTPVSSQANLRIGQTGALGDLRVTLDQVTTAAAQAGNSPEPGFRYIFAYYTIENKGKTAMLTGAFGQTSFKDATGNFYPFDNNANSNLPLNIVTSMAKGIAAGAKGTGIVGYQVRSNAGDLSWTIMDAAGHQDIFAVKASDITVQQRDPGADATGTSIAATTSAIIELGNRAIATDAALTQSPGTPEPTETPEPSDTPAPTETPVP